MAIKCGWASIGETGKGRGNKAGDQTGREVKTGGWYYFNQKTVYRWKDRKLAKNYANNIIAMCDNDHIGYDMTDRDTLWNLLNKVGWDPSKVKKDVETDCSQLVACGVNCTLGKALISKAAYTGNLDSMLMNTGYFQRLTAGQYLVQDDYLMTGDIINAPGHHVISALADGSKAKTTSFTELKKGSKGAAVKTLQTNLKKLGYKGKDKKALAIDGDFGTNTDYALRAFQKAKGLVVDGIYGLKSDEAMKKAIS